MERTNNVKRLLAWILTAALLCCAIPAVSAAGSSYTDVPADSWALSEIESAKTLGLMQGQGNGRFGYDKTMTRAEFVTMLCNLMQWETVTPAQPSYTDVASSAWYYGAVETAAANGAVDQGGAFRPTAAITRSEMAVMFVRALGLQSAAELAEDLESPFTDVTSNRGYITVAYDLGIVNGKGNGIFAPGATAKRQEAAAMIVRVYERYRGETTFTHGFYAISSYSQKDLAARMDAVTYMWSELRQDGSLDTTSGTYCVPDGYDSIVTYLNDSDVAQNLGVYMDVTGGAAELLLDSSARSAAVDAILAEVTKSYDGIGSNPYGGVTMDIEGLRGADVRTAYTAFLKELAEGLDKLGKTLYVAVQPALPDGSYYDGYDYRTIGELADKVILMAHDYAPTDLSDYVGTSWQRNAALTPIDQVYYALKAVTDPETGVADHSKLVLAISFDAVAWQIDDQGKLVSGKPVSVSLSRVAELLAGGAQPQYSQTYRNPYLIYEADDGDRLFLWYEDSRSVAEKLALARFFGVTGVSVWRLGNLPATNAYDVADLLLPS